MKKLLVCLLVAALLISVLSACASGGVSDLDDYRALMGEMGALREYRFTGDVTIALGDAFQEASLFDFVPSEEGEALPMRFAVAGSVSHTHREMVVSYITETADGESLDVDMILGDGVMYIGLVSALEQALRPMLAGLRRDVTNFDVRDILGDHTHLMIPYEGEFEDMLLAPAEFSGMTNLEPFLTRDGGRFTITLEGEDVTLAADEIGAVLEQFTPQGSSAESESGDMLGDVARKLTEADLEDARMLVIVSRSEAAFYQTIELQVPNFLDMLVNFTFTMDSIASVGTPQHALWEEAFTALLLAVDFAELFPETHEIGETSGLEDEVPVEEDLYTLDLLNPALVEGTLLELESLGEGEEANTVAVIGGASVTMGEFHITVDADAIGMIYTVLEGLTAVETVLLAVATDRAGTFLSDSEITVSVLRTNEAHTMAAMAVAEETGAGITRVYIYLAQSIDERSVLRLELSFYLDFFTEEDHEIVTELSQQFGINLRAYITGLLSELYLAD